MLHHVGDVVLHDIRELIGSESPRGDELGQLLVPDQIVTPEQLAGLAGDVRDGVSIGEDEVVLSWLSLVKLLRVASHDLSEERGVPQHSLVVFAVKGDIVGLRTEVEQPSLDSEVMQLCVCRRAQSPKEKKSEGQHVEFSGTVLVSQK